MKSRWTSLLSLKLHAANLESSKHWTQRVAFYDKPVLRLLHELISKKISTTQSQSTWHHSTNISLVIFFYWLKREEIVFYSWKRLEIEKNIWISIYFISCIHPKCCNWSHWLLTLLTLEVACAKSCWTRTTLHHTNFKTTTKQQSSTVNHLRSTNEIF